ncbi:type III glutamate--ammonia ligase [Prescottella equi]|uniref:type III glutamate--ammonia ligase n=1 Tax=Rhodococcus hoagii TaxID=43767 RepID=UPI0009BE8F89|nr:type III glutamate--ammonia ligase [Prescottella equi]MBM4472375.1 type III glutamate--ammonia ligase [Prescottella equi]MBM4520637.1 type III glutamate--ammonia ligase [Prescottella equi]MBM4532062.1 type III glutamate--ammonia ligase [Prescottella equi]MBM4543265.1 type III glutamate--ammonia ligase [Prescottella equi]MBM4569781.1 type III glutamate--ammonia ligase [Prescottella equi]
MALDPADLTVMCLPEAGASDRPDLATLARTTDTRFVLAVFTNLAGKPCAKLVPVEAVEELQEDGVGFAGYAAGAMGQVPADPDLVAVPDAASFTPIPFVRPGLALVHCDPHVQGEPWPFAPRVILKKVLGQAGDLGLEVNVGTEIEYFLVDRDGDGGLRTADALDTSRRPCYDARDVTRMYEHLTAISAAMNQLGWGNYANDHEDGNGQFEQNFRYADALTTADRVVTLRYLISVLAEQRGMTATFMPKPFADRTGSGMHMHLSLWRDGAPVFPDHTDPRGLGLSPTAYAFIGGILEHAGGLQGVLAPTVNSYKRTGATSTSSGATWSPRRPTYGGNDRTHYLRVPDASRVELRGGDGSANPYLASAVTVAAGLDGIRRGTDPGEPGGGICPDDLPMTLLHAMDALGKDAVVTGALDAAGPGVADYFTALKRDEFFEWHSTVTPWEVDSYLTAF